MLEQDRKPPLSLDSSVVRALARKAKGRGFDSCSRHNRFHFNSIDLISVPRMCNATALSEAQPGMPTFSRRSAVISSAVLLIISVYIYIYI